MARIPGIPIDSDINIAQNATTWASKITVWLTTIAEAFGTAAFKDASSDSSTAADDDLLEKQAFGTAAFRNVGGNVDENLATIQDLNNAGGATVGTSTSQVPSNDRVNTLITQAFNDSKNKQTLELYASSTGLNIPVTASDNGSRINIVLAQRRDLDDFDFITLCFSRSDVGIISQTIPEATIKDGTDTNILLTDGHILGMRRNNAGTQLGFFHSNYSGNSAVRLHAVIGGRW